MRNTCRSWKAARTWSFSATAVWMSRPNGFSTMTRAKWSPVSFDKPVAARFCRIAEYELGGVAR